MRRPAGFTIIEMIVVLLLMSIIAATVLGRAITSTDLDLNAQTDKIRNHLRYAQSMAMKTAYDAFPFWGIQSNGSDYWLFRRASPGNTDEEVRLPGGDYSGTSTRISLPSTVTLSSFRVYFDAIGRPFDETNAALISAKNITISSGGTRTVTIEPETGLVR